MKYFENPEIQVTVFYAEDVITVSVNVNENNSETAYNKGDIATPWG